MGSFILHAIAAMLFGIEFLITTQPTLASATGAMVVSTLLGLTSSLAFVLAGRTAASDGFDPREEHSS